MRAGCSHASARGWCAATRRAGAARSCYAPAPERRIVDGRPVGAEDAWLLSVEALDAFDRREPDEILQIDVATGARRAQWRAPAGVAVLDLDWIAARPR